MAAMLDALDRGLVVFKTNSGLIVAGKPTVDIVRDLEGHEMVWDQSDLAEARRLSERSKGAEEWVAEVMALSHPRYPDEVTFEVALACYGVRGLMLLTKAVLATQECVSGP